MADEALIAEVEAKIEALKLRLPGLEGKANKRERTAVNKEIYALENDDAYAAAVKAQLEGARAGAAAADDAEHAAKLAAEKEKEAANAEAGAAARARRLAEAEAAAKADDDGEVHLSKVQLKKGDGATYPSKGEQVLVTYQGRFADGTSHEGRDFSGGEFDSTWDSKKKAHKPLSFPFGVGKCAPPPPARRHQRWCSARPRRAQGGPRVG